MLTGEGDLDYEYFYSNVKEEKGTRLRMKSVATHKAILSRELDKLNESKAFKDGKLFYLLYGYSSSEAFMPIDKSVGFIFNEHVEPVAGMYLSNNNGFEEFVKQTKTGELTHFNAFYQVAVELGCPFIMGSNNYDSIVISLYPNVAGGGVYNFLESKIYHNPWNTLAMLATRGACLTYNKYNTSLLTVGDSKDDSEDNDKPEDTKPQGSPKQGGSTGGGKAHTASVNSLFLNSSDINGGDLTILDKICNSHSDIFIVRGSKQQLVFIKFYTTLYVWDPYIEQIPILDEYTEMRKLAEMNDPLINNHLPRFEIVHSGSAYDVALAMEFGGVRCTHVVGMRVKILKDLVNYFYIFFKNRGKKHCDLVPRNMLLNDLEIAKDLETFEKLFDSYEAFFKELVKLIIIIDWLPIEMEKREQDFYVAPKKECLELIENYVTLMQQARNKDENKCDKLPVAIGCDYKLD